MASPKIEVFFLYDGTGAPLTGATPVFDTYKDDLGANLAQPAISEIGGGAYKFTPVLDPARGIVYVVDGGASASPRRSARFVRPEDFNDVDDISSDVTDIWDMLFGKQQIHVSGGDNHRLVCYREDGVTVLKKFDLFDQAGAPTSINPFRRDPV